EACSSDPRRLRLLRRAREWADRTPWALGAMAVAPVHDPARQWVMVEVQTRCRGAFAAPESTPAEEAFARRCAQLERENDGLRQERDEARVALEEVAGAVPATASGPGLLQRVKRAIERWRGEGQRQSREVECLTSAFLEESERQVGETRRARQEGLA